MAHIPGQKLTVLLNDTDISNKITSGSTTLQTGNVARTWDLELSEPMEILPTDTWTIRLKIAGYERTICQDCLAQNVGGEDSVDASSGNVFALRSTRRVTGQIESDLLEYCLPTTLVFVNQDWLHDFAPGATIQDGILVYPVNALGIAGGRIYHPRLPGKEFESDSFTCILGVQSHHDIAKYLARLIGYDLHVNTPDVTIIDTMTIPSGTTWMSAIEGIFKTLWRPTIEIVGTTIYVSDVIKDDAVINPVQTISLTNAAIQGASLSHSMGGSRDRTIDHVIVTGRRTQDTTVLLAEEPDYTPIEIPEVHLDADTTIESSRALKTSSYKQMGEYDGSFGVPGEQVTPVGLATETRTMNLKKIEKEGRRRYLTISETIQHHNKNGTLVAKTVINHYYSKGLQPLRTVERHYARFNMPRTDVKELHLLQTKTTLQRQVVKPLNLTLTEEIIEGLVLHEESSYQGQVYKDNPQILSDVLRSDTMEQVIDASPNANQWTLEMTLSERSTEISRIDDNTLIKRELTHDKLTDITRINSQILENPLRDRNTLKSDHIFRKEYFDGSGTMIGGYGPCYHPPGTIHHDDICTEELADQVAERALSRKSNSSTNNPTWDITIPFPVPIENLGVIVTLPDFQARVNGELVTVSGGDYVLRKVDERWSYRDRGSNRVDLDAETVLSVRLKA